MSSAAFEWNVLYKSIESFKAWVSLLTFCLDDLSMEVSVLLQSPTIMYCYYSFFPLDLVIIVLYILVLLGLKCIYISHSMFSQWIGPFVTIHCPFFVSYYHFWFEFCFVSEYGYTCFFWLLLPGVSSSLPSILASVCL